MVTQMAELNIKIEVPEEEFQSYCVEKMQDLPEEMVQQVLLTAIAERMKQDDFYIATITNGWNTQKVQTAVLDEMINLVGVSLGEKAQPIADEISNYIIQNYEGIIRDSIIYTFSNVLFDSIKDGEVRDHIYAVMNNHMRSSHGLS